MEGSREGRGYLPEEWGDPERMRTLMGPLPDHSVNHVAHNARLTFWSAAIHSWATAERRPFFTAAECQGAFRRGSQVPVCLPEVLQLMIRQGEVVSMDQLDLTDPKQETWTSWGHRVFLARPTHLLWGHLKYLMGRNTLGNGVLVCRSVLKEMCDSLTERVWEEKNRPGLLFTLKNLHNISRETVGTVENLELIVKVLVTQGKAVTVLHNGTLYVKFGNPGDVQAPVVLSEELAKSDIEEAKEKVEESLKVLEEERQTLRKQAKDALGRGAKNEALSLLRRRKRIDKSVLTQLGVLENLMSWLHHLDNTQTNRQVLGALKGGVEALRTALAGDASLDTAANTLDDLQEVLEECEDLNALISTNPVPEDLTGLEEELKGLVLEAGPEEGLVLPDVPTNPLPAAADATTTSPRFSQ